MPLEGLEEEGLPKNPDLHLMQLKYLICSGEGGVAAEAWAELMETIKENCEREYKYPHTQASPHIFATAVKYKLRGDLGTKLGYVWDVFLIS